MMATFTSRVDELRAHAQKLDTFIAEKGLSSPDFDTDPLHGVSLPDDVKAARDALMNGAHNMKSLTAGPKARLVNMALNWTENLALRFIYHYRLSHHVPREGSIAYADLGRAVGLPGQLVRRFVRMGMASNVFDETPDGEVRHTAISRMLATEPLLEDLIGLQVEELSLAACSYIDAIDKWGPDGMTEPNRTAFALQNGIDVPIFEFFKQNPERGRRFGGAMKFFTSDASWDLRHLSAAFDWSTLDREGALIIDVGGGLGQVSHYLARQTSKVRFHVQDLAHVVESAKKQPPPEDLDSARFEYVTQNFLSPQPAQPQPDAFLLRWILHNWSDKYALQILKTLIPALRPGAKILIFEFVPADRPVKDATEYLPVAQDMIMAACFNGMERDREDFRKLLAEADPNFVIDRFRQPHGSAQTLVEITWKP